MNNRTLATLALAAFGAACAFIPPECPEGDTRAKCSGLVDKWSRGPIVWKW